jgi:hypothetical protein
MAEGGGEGDAVELGEAGGELFCGAGVVDGDVGALAGEEAGEGDAFDAEADDEEARGATPPPSPPPADARRGGTGVTLVE